MMTKQTQNFIKEHIELIDKNQWDEFYDIVELDINFQLLYQIGELTTFLTECGCDPLNYLTKIPIGFMSGTPVEEFTIPEGIKSIGMGAFRGCQHLKKIVIPKSCGLIGTNAFFYCSSLEDVTIESTNQYFGDNVFDACPKLYDIKYLGTKDQWMEHPICDVDFVINCTDGRIVVDAEGKVRLNE